MSTSPAMPQPAQPSDFEVEYFTQTRREIDSEKQERNKVLNFGILAAGGFSYALAQLGKSSDFLVSPSALAFYGPYLALITVLTATRRFKLQQIADRWFVLEEFLKTRHAPSWMWLEACVCVGLRTRRYLYEDLWLHLGLSSIVYVLLTAVAAGLWSDVKYWRAAGVALIVILHFVLSVVWLTRPALFRRPT